MRTERLAQPTETDGRHCQRMLARSRLLCLGCAAPTPRAYHVPARGVQLESCTRSVEEGVPPNGRCHFRASQALPVPTATMDETEEGERSQGARLFRDDTTNASQFA